MMDQTRQHYVDLDSWDYCDVIVGNAWRVLAVAAGERTRPAAGAIFAD
jgi:hypothetical protein